MERFKAWLNQPFDPGMSVFHWWLFFGACLVMLAIWGLIFKHIEEGL